MAVIITVNSEVHAEHVCFVNEGHDFWLPIFGIFNLDNSIITKSCLYKNALEYL